MQALQVEKWQLKEELQGWNNQCKELELTQELVAVREENIHLTKELDEVTTLYKKAKMDLQASEQLEEELQQQVNEQSELVQKRQELLDRKLSAFLHS